MIRRNRCKVSWVGDDIEIIGLHSTTLAHKEPLLKFAESDDYAGLVQYIDGLCEAAQNA